MLSLHPEDSGSPTGIWRVRRPERSDVGMFPPRVAGSFLLGYDEAMKFGGDLRRAGTCLDGVGEL